MSPELFQLSFTKAHGLGNDFVLVDNFTNVLKSYEDALPNLARFLANRRYGIGCDQVIILGGREKKGFSVRFFNADGSEAEACGNGTRCAARYLMERIQTEQVTLATEAGSLFCEKKNDQISVHMTYTQCIQGVNLEEYGRFSLPPAVYVALGNPHLVCFVEKLDHGKNLGSVLEKQVGLVNPDFPERVNVGFAKVMDTNTIALSVFERGVGFTPACGTGACAAAIAAFSHNLVERQVTVVQEGGALTITILDGQALCMTGHANLVFQGTISITESVLRDAATPGCHVFYGATLVDASIKSKAHEENTFQLTADFGHLGMRTTEVCLSPSYTQESLVGLGVVGTLGCKNTFTILGQQDAAGAIILQKKPDGFGNGDLVSP